MRVRIWADKVLWFVLGVVTAGALMFITPAYSKRAEPLLAVVPAQDIPQRVSFIEQRMYGIEQWMIQHEAQHKAAAKAAQEERDRQNRANNKKD